MAFAASSCAPASRSRLRLRSLTMGEATLALGLAALFLIGVAYLAIEAMTRVKASSRASELRSIVSAVHFQYSGQTHYTGLLSSGIASGMPQALRAPDGRSLILGSSRIPVLLWPGADHPRSHVLGAHGSLTFLVAVGSSTFPISDPVLCARLVTLYDHEHVSLRGFQLRSAYGFEPSSRSLRPSVIDSPSPNNFTATVSTSLRTSDPSLSSPVLEPLSDALFDTAGPYRLDLIQPSHVQHACARLTERPAGAVLLLAFT